MLCTFWGPEGLGGFAAIEIGIGSGSRRAKPGSAPRAPARCRAFNDHELPTEQLAIGRQMSPITDAAAFGLDADSLLVDE